MKSGIAIVLLLAACGAPTPAVDAGFTDSGPGLDLGPHVPVCQTVGEIPVCPDGRPLVCPNGHWIRPGDGQCYAVPYMGEEPPPCTTTGNITVVPRCVHGLPGCLPPDPVTGCGN